MTVRLGSTRRECSHGRYRASDQYDHGPFLLFGRWCCPNGRNLYISDDYHSPL